MIAVYESVLYNDGSSQHFLWYPMYLTPQLLGSWYSIVHFIGFIPDYKLSVLTDLSTVSEFDATWQRLVAWGYIYSFALGTVYVFLSIALIRRLTGVWQVAVLAGIALAFSSGIALGYRILRAELLCSALVIIALLLTLVAAKSPRSPWRFFYLGLAGLLASLALAEKVQALIPLLTIPVIALAFGTEESNDPKVRTGSGFRLTALCLLSLAVVVPTINLVEQGITNMASSYVHPVGPRLNVKYYHHLAGGLSGFYQWLLVSYVALSMLLYAWLWRVRPIDVASGILAVYVGLALGLLTLHWRYDPIVVSAIANPLEHLRAVSPAHGRSLTELGIESIKGLIRVLSVHTFFLHPSHRPTLIVEWVSIYAAFLLWRRGDKQVALQVAVLLLAVIAIEALFSLRGGVAHNVSIFYVPFTDPLIVLAGAIALSHFYMDLLSLKAQRLVLGCMLIYVFWGHFEPIRATYGDKSKRKVCVVVAHFVQGIRIPYCQNSDWSKAKEQDEQQDTRRHLKARALNVSFEGGKALVQTFPDARVLSRLRAHTDAHHRWSTPGRRKSKTFANSQRYA